MSKWDDRPFYFDCVAEQIFHATSERNFAAIIVDTEIKSNRGERPFTFPQSASSYARKMGYVPLFDFYNCTEEKIRVMANVWPRMIAKSRPAILIVLDRSKVGSSLITSAMAALDFGGEFMKANYHVPRVEAWYPNAVPLAFCDHALRIDWSSRRVNRIALPR